MLQLLVVPRRYVHLAPAAIFTGPTDYHGALNLGIDCLDPVVHPIEPARDLVEHIQNLMLIDMLFLLLLFVIMFRILAMMMVPLMRLSGSVISMIHPLMAGALTFLRVLLTPAPLINVATQFTFTVFRLIFRRGSLGGNNLLDATIGITTVGLFLLDALEVLLPI
jgi:hypothetical protein